MKKSKVSASVFFNFDEKPSTNFRYFSGFTGYGCLIIKPFGKPILLVPEMEYLRAKKTKNRNKVVIYKKPFFKFISKYLKGKIIGLDYSNVTLQFFKAIQKELKGKKFKDVFPHCASCRLAKTRTEITYLRKACKISDKILAKCFKNFKKFKTEFQVAEYLIEQTTKEGCVVSFPPIIASGSNAAEPHHEPKNRPLKKGFCIIDFGVKYKGYCSDTTRVLYLGTPTRKALELYEFMLKGQKNMVKFSKAGVKCGKIYDYSVEQLGKYAKYFTHGLGHGVGLNIHELPNLKPGSIDLLENGIAFTVEPGIYLPGKLGIRIEDTVLIKNGKPEILTKISKNLRIVK